MAKKTWRTLRKPDDFKQCFARGDVVKNRLAVLHVLKRDDYEPSRIGLSVSRRMGTAVIRNRVKRWMRESIRPFYSDLRDGFDLVLSARFLAKEQGYWPLKEAVYDVLQKAGLLREEKDES